MISVELRVAASSPVTVPWRIRELRLGHPAHHFHLTAELQSFALASFLVLHLSWKGSFRAPMLAPSMASLVSRVSPASQRRQLHNFSTIPVSSYHTLFLVTLFCAKEPITIKLGKLKRRYGMSPQVTLGTHSHNGTLNVCLMAQTTSDNREVVWSPPVWWGSTRVPRNLTSPCLGVPTLRIQRTCNYRVSMVSILGIVIVVLARCLIVGYLDPSVRIRLEICPQNQNIHGTILHYVLYIILYFTIPYHTIPYHTILYHTIPYHTIPYHTIPYHTIPYHTIPYHTIPYHTIPYHTIPYHTIPYHTILYYTILYYTILYHIIFEMGPHNAWVANAQGSPLLNSQIPQPGPALFSETPCTLTTKPVGSCQWFRNIYIHIYIYMYVYIYICCNML